MCRQRAAYITRSAVALFGLTRRAESTTTATAHTVRIHNHGTVRCVDRTTAQEAGKYGQGTEEFHQHISKNLRRRKCIAKH